MRNQKLLSLLYFSFFIAFFSSCIDNDYDLSNDKIDPNVLLSSDGVNMPIGNVEKILIFENIGYDDIKENPDGSLYIEFESELDPEQFKIPDYDIGDIGEVSMENPIELDLFPSGAFDFRGLSVSDIVPLCSMRGSIEYEVTKPDFENTDENEWTIDPDIIVFDVLTFYLKFKLEGFGAVQGNAKINLHLKFPVGFEVEGLDANRTITRSVDFNTQNPGDWYVLQEGITVKSYAYLEDGVSNVSVDLDLGSMSGFHGNVVSAPQFYLTFSTDDFGKLIQYIKGKVKGYTSIINEITGFDDLRSSFGEDAVLQFANPSLFLSVTTNLESDFRFDIDKIDGHNVPPISLTGNNGLWFEKPAGNTFKTTSYYIAPKPDEGRPQGAIGKQLGLNALFTSIPELIDYNFSFNVNETDAIVRNNSTVEGSYKFTLPFDFENLNVNVKIAPIDLGDSDFLEYVKSTLTIEADEVFISGEKFNPLTLIAAIKFLDSGGQREVFKAKTVELEKGLNKSKFVFSFSKEELEMMEKAKYLNIELTLKGKGALTKEDYIDIRGLRIISDGGIPFELNL